jgi:coniferyl-aldehyde dehydrogenase
MNEITNVTELTSRFAAQKKYFAGVPFPCYEQRIDDLQALKKLLLNNQQDFIDALAEDFGHRSADDTKIGDLLTTVSGINYSIKRLKKWMKPQRKHVGILFQPGKAEVIYQPKGVIGIITPWNYPLFLALGPLTTTLAAGNVAMIKMSEFTPKTSTLLAKLLANIFSKEKVSIVNGDSKIAAYFSGLAFDHLFFTGSTPVGKLVMKAAAENLVPVTLELGGKSPAIIDDAINISTAVSRLIFGKTLNSGQTCVAPDYILCPKDKCEQLISELKTRYRSMYASVEGNDDCTYIIPSQRARLSHLLVDAQEKGARIVSCLAPDSDISANDNSHNRETSVGTQDLSIPAKMPLTLISNATDDMLVMQQEIFGPILPIIAYDNIDEAIAYINARPRPLALYIYSFNKSFQQRFLKYTHAGGVCINDAAFHVANEDLPFGGIGASGMGQYHGEEGFRTFSHGKSVLSRGRISFTPLLFPPFGTWVHKLVYRLFIR